MVVFVENKMDTPVPVAILINIIYTIKYKLKIMFEGYLYYIS